MHQTSHYITTLLKQYSAHRTSTTAHGKYTQASTWLLEVTLYLEKVFWMEYWNKYIYWQKVFKIPKYQILNLQYFKYQIQKVCQNTYLKYKYFKYCQPLLKSGPRVLWTRPTDRRAETTGRECVYRPALLHAALQHQGSLNAVLMSEVTGRTRTAVARRRKRLRHCKADLELWAQVVESIKLCNVAFRFCYRGCVCLLASEMTCIVSSGALNSTHSLPCVCVREFQSELTVSRCQHGTQLDQRSTKD